MSANEVLNGIVKGIQDSKLNFTMNLTPFSAYITIRSSFIKNYVPVFDQQTQQNRDQLKAKELENKNKILTLKVKSLEKENVTLKEGFENLAGSKNTSETINSEASAAVKEEKRLLQVKHEKICAEIKLIKNEKEDLVKKCNALSVADKANKKEIFDLKKRLDKNSEEFESQVRDLKAFKEQKLAEERAIKHIEKKNKKKARKELLNEAKVKAEQLKSDRTPKKNLDKNANSPPLTVQKVIGFEVEESWKKMGTSENMVEEGVLEFDENSFGNASEIDNDDKPSASEKKKNPMSQEQEKAFLEQFQKILEDSFPDLYTKEASL